jgi:acyl-CoA synthetase (AMP-forming)/AMP-acid ligase II
MNTLSLLPGDRCMNIMPLFYIQGLIAAVLSSLRAVASIYCSSGFNALKFFGWMDDAKPTWYTAVPTMHQTILTRASRSQDIINAVPLRFIRSSSSSLASQVMTELEKYFNAPVVEAYGMTEAVGIAAGPEVGIMSLNGEILANGEVGEIVIRGANITKGYENNPKANEKNFTNGWFRTGDQGVLDSEGYISITGRLKEIINRGGEKISPRAVDEILMDHPAIQQCVTPQ